MKTNSNQNKCALKVFKTYNSITRFTAICLTIAVINLSISCSYFTVRDVPTTEETIVQEVNNFNVSEKYVVLHTDANAWHLKDMILNDDEQIISGSIEPLSEAHIYKKLRDSKIVHRYELKEQDPLNEIHFYLKTPSSFQFNQDVSIPLKDIEKMSYNDKNTGRTVVNIFIGTVGVAFAGLLIYTALKTSCPFVYIKNGEEFHFTGELYPGIIAPNLQKNDYLALPNFYPEDGNYTLKVANELKEIQYTDQLQLLTVNHPKGIKVLIDKNGELQTFKNIKAPFMISSNSSTDILDLALRKDNNYYSFNAPETTLNSVRSIVFQFDKPIQSEGAKLYLTAKNSAWLDYVFGKFNEQFGAYYNTFQKKQQHIKKEELNKWINGQHIPLSVYIKTNQGWKLVDKINTVGPLAMRDLVVPIDLRSIKQEIIEIKLETGFMFWEVDYVGIDFSENLDLSITEINPASAIDKNGNDVLSLLKHADQKYFIQPEIGDNVVVKFPSITSTDSLTKTTVYLKNRGYYNYIRNYEGRPDAEKLKEFRKDNAFTKFSEKSYYNFINYSQKKLAQNE